MMVQKRVRPWVFGDSYGRLAFKLRSVISTKVNAVCRTSVREIE
jgi:hypothetical protein